MAVLPRQAVRWKQNQTFPQWRRASDFVKQWKSQSGWLSPFDQNSVRVPRMSIPRLQEM